MSERMTDEQFDAEFEQRALNPRCSWEEMAKWLEAEARRARAEEFRRGEALAKVRAYAEMLAGENSPRDAQRGRDLLEMLGP